MTCLRTKTVATGGRAESCGQHDQPGRPVLDLNDELGGGAIPGAFNSRGGEGSRGKWHNSEFVGQGEDRLGHRPQMLLLHILHVAGSALRAA